MGFKYDFITNNMKNTIYAILRPEEQENDEVTHGTLYKFRYDKHDVLFIWYNGQWNEDSSGAFDFIKVAN